MLTLNSEKLRQLLGHTLTYQGISCQIIEILGDDPALVLRDCQNQKVIHADQYGDAGEWLPRTFTVSLFNERRDGINPALPDLAMLDLFT